MYEEKPRKVHLYHDQKGATIRNGKRLFANTLCKMNSDVPDSHITTDPEKVTCKICQKDRRFYMPKRIAATPPLQASIPRTRYRRNWRGKLILQVETQVPVNYDPADPYEMRSMDEVTHVGRWRDAKLEDLNIGVV